MQQGVGDLPPVVAGKRWDRIDRSDRPGPCPRVRSGIARFYVVFDHHAVGKAVRGDRRAVDAVIGPLVMMQPVVEHRDRIEIRVSIFAIVQTHREAGRQFVSDLRQHGDRIARSWNCRVVFHVGNQRGNVRRRDTVDRSRGATVGKTGAPVLAQVVRQHRVDQFEALSAAVVSVGPCEALVVDRATAEVIRELGILDLLAHGPFAFVGVFHLVDDLAVLVDQFNSLAGVAQVAVPAIVGDVIGDARVGNLEHGRVGGYDQVVTRLERPGGELELDAVADPPTEQVGRRIAAIGQLDVFFAEILRLSEIREGLIHDLAEDDVGRQ